MLNFSFDTRPKKKKFQLNVLEIQRRPFAYLKECFQSALEHIKFERDLRSLSQQQLRQILEWMGFQPNDFQLLEGYNYAVFDKKYGELIELLSKSRQSKQGLGVIPKNIIGKSSFELDAFIEWLQNSYKSLLQSASTKQSPAKGLELPRLNQSFQQPSAILKTPEDHKKKKIENELNELLSIFDKMDNVRQENGLAPVDMRSEDSDKEMEVGENEKIRMIPYDPDLHDMNQQLSHLKNQAEAKIKVFIEKAIENQRVRKKLETGIKQFQSERIQANEKVGRLGAIHARQRLVDAKKQQLEKISKDIDFVFLHQDDLLKNQKFNYFMNIPTKPQKREKRISNYRDKTRVQYLLENKLQF